MTPPGLFGTEFDVVPGTSKRVWRLALCLIYHSSCLCRAVRVGCRVSLYDCYFYIHNRHAAPRMYVCVYVCMEPDPSDLILRSSNKQKNTNQQTDENLGIKYRIELSKPKALGRQF